MKPFCRFVFGALLLFGSYTYAQENVFEVVKVFPKKGKPITLTNFYLPWGQKVKALWNQQRVEIPVANIKAVRFLGIHPTDKYDLEVEFTMKNGAQAMMRISDVCHPCEGDAPSGLIRLRADEISALYFSLD